MVLFFDTIIFPVIVYVVPLFQIFN
jgi:hypothetical protein